MAVALYGVSSIYSVFLLRRGFREDNRANYILLLGAFVFHAMALFMRGFSFHRCPIHNLFEALMFVTWTIASVYMVLGLIPRLRFFGAFASHVLFALGVFALMPPLDVRHTARPEFVGVAASLHAALILLAYGAFGLGFVAALMYVTQERNLKVNKLRAVMALLPPIQRLERITDGTLAGGFVLLTVGFVIGAHGLKTPEGMTLQGDPKVIWSGVVWLIYGTLLVLRWKFSQRGRRMACGALGAFAFVMMTFWGSRLMSTIHTP